MKPHPIPPAPPAHTPLADARRMAAQQFSLPNIRRTLAQKHHLTPAAIDAILAQITPITPANALPPCPAPQPC